MGKLDDIIYNKLESCGLEEIIIKEVEELKRSPEFLQIIKEKVAESYKSYIDEYLNDNGYDYFYDEISEPIQDYLKKVIKKKLL